MKFEYVVPLIFQDTIICIINQQRKRILLGVQGSQEDITKEEMFVIRDFQEEVSGSQTETDHPPISSCHFVKVERLSK